MTGFAGFARRTAVVTGAGGGMGLRIATDLLAADATVVGIDLKDRPDALDDALYHQGDVSDAGFVGQAIGSVYAETGRLDYLVNAAGVLWFGRDRSLLEVELEVWNRVIAINLTGCMLAARHAIPLMRKTGGGALVHFSSTQCLRGDDQPKDAYQVAKAGILALSKSIAIQFALACVSHGWVQDEAAGARWL
jgi:NAD(P)-dependent dehydrogenase (short-subunit alcohol dehydrogenase family)